MAKVLVVEDNQENAELMCYLLRAFGHEAAVARDGAAGVAAVAAGAPDVVLMDLHMPIMDGFAAVAAIRADPALRDVRVVAVTAYAMSGDREKVLAAGFDGYLTKPIDPQTFVGDVERLVAPGRR